MTTETGFAENEDIRIRLRRKPGDGHPILCVPGIPCVLAHWDRFLDLVDDSTYAPWLMERPGWYESTADGKTHDFETQLRAIDLAVDSMDVSEITLVGHSYGSVLSLLYATRHPEKIRRVLALSGPSRPSAYPGLMRPMGAAAGALPLLPSYLRSVLKDAAQVRRALKALNKALISIRVPVYLLHGDKDGIVPVSHFRHRRDLIPDNQLAGAMVLTGRNHAIPENTPEDILEHLDIFIGMR